MDATVFLSSVIMSDKARSDKVSGFTCSTLNCSAGINHGSPAPVVSIYSSSNFFLPEALANSSVSASTLIIKDGFHLDSINPLPEATKAVVDSRRCNMTGILYNAISIILAVLSMAGLVAITIVVMELLEKKGRRK